MSSPSSKQSSRASSITAPEHSPSKTHSNGAFSLKSTLMKPFQGWSMELMRARDDDDDDYNFASGLRRGCMPLDSHRN
jgi:hypothetical protein